MPRTKTWEISDEFWAVVEPLVPTTPRVEGQVYLRRPGGGRKARYGNRTYFEAMVYVLRTGIIWNALPREKFGGLSSAAVHRKFRQWSKQGFFVALWRSGLAEYDDLEGIAWEWLAADGFQLEAPLAKESVGPNPTDRGKKRDQAVRAGGRAWRPAVARRRRSEPARQRAAGSVAGGHGRRDADAEGETEANPSEPLP
jgi:transposase